MHEWLKCLFLNPMGVAGIYIFSSGVQISSSQWFVLHCLLWYSTRCGYEVPGM